MASKSYFYFTKQIHGCSYTAVTLQGCSYTAVLTRLWPYKAVLTQMMKCWRSSCSVIEVKVWLFLLQNIEGWCYLTKSIARTS